MTKYILIFLILYTNLSYSQDIIYSADGENEHNISNFRIDLQESLSSYVGNYHFGFSENESDLEIKISGKRISAEFSYQDYDEKTNNWIYKYIKLKNVKIIGNMLLADNWYGIFVTEVSDENKTYKGMIIYKSSHGISNEFGYKMDY